MAVAVSLNDVARMLSTKGGDISTIGGAIGCMSAMISGDAREKDNTTSNDIKKIKEFICGDGGSLSSMIDRLELAISEQNAHIKHIIDGNKEKKLFKTDISRIIKGATSGLEKRLDNILDSLNMIAKNQGGNIKWENPKKTKDSIEQFKNSLNDKNKIKDSKIGKFVSMLTELKVLSLKDLLLFKPKMKLLEKISPQINSLAKNISAKNVAKVSDFLQKSPKMFKDLFLSIKMSNLIKEKDLDRFYKILGITDKKKPKKNTILGLIDSFGKLNKTNLVKSKKNVDLVFGMVREICLGVGILVLFSPVIMLAGLLSKPLKWALFGFNKKGDGGIMGIFKKLSKKKDDIKEANKSILWMSLGFASLGAGLGLLFALTNNINLVRIIEVASAALAFTGITVLIGKSKKNIKEGSEAMMYMALGVGTLGLGMGIMFALTKDVDWEQMAIVGVSIASFALITALMGKVSDSIKEGSEAMMYMALGVGVLGLGLGIMFSMTKDVSWEQMAMVGVSIIGLGAATVALGALNKSGLVMEGAFAMGIMGIALIPFGFAMKLLMGSVKGMKWNEFGIFAASTLVLGGAVIGLGALMATGFGAVAWGLGLAAIAALGVALIPFGIGMQKISKVAKTIDLKAIENMTNTTKVVFESLGNAADRKTRKEAKKNANAIGSIGKKLGSLSKSLKTFNQITPDSIDKAIKAIEKIAAFFFGEDGMSKYSLDWKKRVKSKKEADTIGKISGIMFKLSHGLRTFNDVAPNSIEKAMSAIEKIAFYFFSPDSELNKMNTGWAKRRKAKKTADAIGTISDCVWKLAKGMKDFNEVSSGSIETAKNAISAIAFYFFSPDSELNKMHVGWTKRKKAKKNADTIGVISDSMYKISRSLKDFQEVGGGVVDRMIETIEKIVNSLFGDNLIKGYFKPIIVERGTKRIADGLAYFDKKTKKIDVKRVRENAEALGLITSNILGNWKDSYKESAKDMSLSMVSLTSALKDGGRKYRNNVKDTTRLFRQMSNPSFVAAGKTLRSASAFIRNVNTVDMEKASSLTDMFKSFASIGKTGGLFSSFDKRVKQFTEACVELVNAINGNTEAINNSEEEVVVKDETGEEKTVKRKDAELMPKQMMLMNVDDLAMAIADQLNSLNVDCDANINLQINNESGNEWRITRM